MHTQTSSHRAAQAVAALVGLGTLAVFTGCAKSAVGPKTTPVHEAQVSASKPGPVTSDAQAMWSVLTGLPGKDVALIVPGLAPQVRQELVGIAAAAVADHSPQVSLAATSLTVPARFDPQAIWSVLISLPGDDVAVIAPGLIPELRDDLNGIAHAIAGSTEH